jgi:YD repeat-containing protein
MLVYGYDDANRLATLTLPNGIVETPSYDSASQLTGITYGLGASTLGSLTYGYDANGRRASIDARGRGPGCPRRCPAPATTRPTS